MSRTRIKFCGIRRRQDADAAVDLGVDAIGFVLVPGSKRHITIEDAARIRERLPPLVTTVALFKDADGQQVQDAIDVLQPDLLQFHGAEDAAFCASFGRPYVKAIALGEGGRLGASVRTFRAARALLLDGNAPGAMGGLGKAFDWKAQAAAVAKLKQPVILAGGLNPDNVAQGIKALRPYAVDVSSGIEARPGVKDLNQMRAFVQAVRRADEKLKKT
ncbi:MAG TPA: phosphoribosylanthranilate isomerase [Solimonas sp.]